MAHTVPAHSSNAYAPELGCTDHLTPRVFAHKLQIMKKDDEPKVWIILLGLLLGVAILVGVVGVALWYSDKAGIAEPTPAKPVTGWGIFTDSPIRSNR